MRRYPTHELTKSVSVSTTLTASSLPLQVLAHEAVEVAQAAMVEAHYYFMFGAPRASDPAHGDLMPHSLVIIDLSRTGL